MLYKTCVVDCLWGPNIEEPYQKMLKGFIQWVLGQFRITKRQLCVYYVEIYCPFCF